MAYDSKNDSSGPRLYCETWNGAKTPGFRKFVGDFKAGADAVSFSSLNIVNVNSYGLKFFSHWRADPL